MLIHKRCTDHRWVLPELARKVVLDCCLHDDGTTMALQIVVIMPDHVHLIFRRSQNGACCRPESEEVGVDRSVLACSEELDSIS